MKRNLDAQLARFIRRTRGDLSYLEFSKKTGLSHTTLHRIEKGEHHLTLLKLGVLLRKLKLTLKDVFPEEY